MFRVIYLSLTLLSLLIAIAMTMLWVRSYLVYDEVHHWGRPWLELRSGRGRVMFYWCYGGPESSAPSPMEVVADFLGDDQIPSWSHRTEAPRDAWCGPGYREFSLLAEWEEDANWPQFGPPS